MRKAILKRFLIVIVVALLICGGLSCYLCSRFFAAQTRQDLLYTLRLLDYNLNYEDNLQQQIDVLNPITLDDNTRITIIDSSGEVLADTALEWEDAENHFEREEIQDAMNHKYGVAQRRSDSLGTYMLYAACRSQKSEYILRLAIPYNGLLTAVETVLPAIIAGVFAALIISMFLARKFAKSVTDPLSEISNELLKVQDNRHVFHFHNYQYEELNNIVVSTAKLSEQIRKSLNKLKYERNKVEYILDNMTEGFILINESQEVLTMNQSARQILQYQGEDLSQNIVHYTQNIDIISAVERAVKEDEFSAFDITGADNRIYSAHISTVKKGILNEHNSGVVILLIDVTNDRQAQQMRQEFFSNVSHELKTPITSIQGFAELLESNMISDENKKKEFLQRIKKETQNMTNLINDILMISRLETKTVDENIAPTKIKPILQEVLSTLEPIAHQSGVTLELECEDIVMNANAQQLHQLCNNLVLNAVKYNRENGKVSITGKKEKESFYLNVSDTGIGIPPDCQQRVFERFFRVDKGRSRKMGGTGLGLSIVKHIVQFYNGSISLESEVGKGTSITIRLPLE